LRIEGEERIALPIARVFEAFADAAVLRASTPGLVRLEETTPGHFEATLELKLPAISGRFDGSVDITLREPPSRMKLRLKGKGPPGFVDGSADLALREAEGATWVRYAADVTIGGQVARLGQRMISGVAKELAGQFFEAFERAAGAGAPGARPPALAGAAEPVAALPAPPSQLRAGLQLLWRLLLRALGLSKRP
jgi:uncharacterized protein